MQKRYYNHKCKKCGADIYYGMCVYCIVDDDKIETCDDEIETTQNVVIQN